ncbi:hypothetical protein F383_03146 [Gossypium arboreum]|uniref:Uncharacterized protein n=1 Tax=Gossypium arboreum TaxID=29729 RepID=A0A0B0PV70_GOSAR|nr:hypothetical protein F383_03146 [Gossypium arboreum]
MRVSVRLCLGHGIGLNMQASVRPCLEHGIGIVIQCKTMSRTWHWH